MSTSAPGLVFPSDDLELRGKEYRSKRALKQTPLERPDLRRRVAGAALVFVPVGVILTAVVVFVSLRYGSWAITISLFSVLFIVLGLAVWASTISNTNMGIRRTDRGVEVFQDSVFSDRVLRYVVHWDEMRDPEVFGGRLGGVSVGTGTALPLILDPRQARNVLTDPRCPLRNKLPQEVSYRIKLD